MFFNAGVSLWSSMTVHTMRCLSHEQIFMQISREVEIRNHLIVDQVFKTKQICVKCEHGKHKYQCKDCSPNAFCEHSKQKTQCKDCSPNTFCEHDRRKGRCKDCSPNAFCEHDWLKGRCRDCDTDLCLHYKRKASCRECISSSFCIHQRKKRQCKDCSPNAFCEYDKRKYQCKDCSPNAFCEHDRRKTDCKECPKCHMHMCEKPVAKSTGNTSAYTWREIEGSQQPTTGTEIYNELLVSALLQ